MILYFILFVILVSIFLKILNKVLVRPKKHKKVKVIDLKEYIEVLWKRGYDSGFMIIETWKSNNYIQFIKYIKDGEIKIYSHFFPSDWIDPYRDEIVRFLNERKIEYSIQDGIIEIDFDERLEDCATFVLDINRYVYKTSEKDMLFTVWYENVSSEDVLIRSV